MTAGEEWKLQRRVSDLVFVTWLQVALLVFIAIMLASTPRCPCKDNTAVAGKRERLSMPYQRNRRSNDGE
jgi:hypothetical protein